jgi:hypothetical protein
MLHLGQSQVRSIWRFTGLIALASAAFAHLQPLFLATAFLLAINHGHDHQIAVQSNGNHFDFRLSHCHDADLQHESPLSLITAVYSKPDHEGADHVLHFKLNAAPDQLRQRNPITAAPTPLSLTSGAAISSVFLLPASTAIVAALPRPSPPSAGWYGLRTIILLI